MMTSFQYSPKCAISHFVLLHGEDFSGHDNAGELLVMSPVLLMTWTGAEKRKLLYDSISMNP